MNFVIYSKENCPYCERMKKVLKLSNLQYQVYTLDKDFVREDFYFKFGEGSTFPQVLYNDEKIGGCVETIRFLKEQKLV